MKRIFSIFCFVCVLFLFCKNSAAEIVDKIIAKVGTEALTMMDLTEFLKRKKYEYLVQGGQQGFQRYDEFRKKALSELILETILDQELTREHISVGSDIVEGEFQYVLKREGLSETQFVQKLSKQGLALAEYKTILEKQIAATQFIQKKIIPNLSISEIDLNSEYEKNKSEYQTYAKFHFIEVFLLPDRFSSDQEFQDKVLVLHQSVQQGKSVSEEVKQYSFGAFADKGGDSGLIDATTLRPELRRVLSSLKVGETSGLLPLDRGIVFFKLLDRAEPQVLPYHQVSHLVRAKYAEKVAEQELRKFLIAIKDQTYTEIIQ